MLHAGNHHVLDEARAAKKFSFQIKSRDGGSHEAVILLRLLGCVVQHFFASLVVQVQVPVSHDMCYRSRADDAILDTDRGRRCTTSSAKACDGNSLDGCAGHTHRFAAVFNRKAARGHTFVRAVMGVDRRMDDLRHGDVELFRRYLCERC